MRRPSCSSRLLLLLLLARSPSAISYGEKARACINQEHV